MLNAEIPAANDRCDRGDRDDRDDRGKTDSSPDLEAYDYIDDVSLWRSREPWESPELLSLGIILVVCVFAVSEVTAGYLRTISNGVATSGATLGGAQFGANSFANFLLSATGWASIAIAALLVIALVLQCWHLTTWSGVLEEIELVEEEVARIAKHESLNENTKPLKFSANSAVNHIVRINALATWTTAIFAILILGAVISFFGAIAINSGDQTNQLWAEIFETGGNLIGVFILSSIAILVSLRVRGRCKRLLAVKST